MKKKNIKYIIQETRKFRYHIIIITVIYKSIPKNANVSKHHSQPFTY